MSLRPTKLLPYVLWVLLFFLMGHKTARAQGTMSELPVAGAFFCSNSRFECPRWRPFIKIGELGGPIYFLISTSGMGCEVDGMVAGKIQRPGEEWACVWRGAQP